MEGDGPDDADFMIIGEATGELNRPFVGQAGEYLRDELLLPAEIPESKVRFTNATRCHPPKNRTPTVTEIKRCRRYLEVEIRKVKPKVIVGMGNVPLASLLQFFYKGQTEEGTAKKQESKVSGILSWRGERIWLQEFQCWFFPTAHPSYCMRGKRMQSEYSTGLVIEDLKEAWRYVDKDRPVYKVPKSVYVDNVTRAFTVIDKFWGTPTFAFDIETGGSGRAIDKYVIGCSFASSPDIGYYISWELLSSNKFLFQRFKKLLTSKQHYKVMHNGAYEVRILSFVHGININNVKYFDTMAAFHLINENFSKRLKDLAWIFTNFGGYDIPLERYKTEHKIKEDYSGIPIEMLSSYGALDSVAAWILYTKLRPAMKQEGVSSLFNKIVMPVRRVMSDAELNGMYVDKRRAAKLGSLCKSAIGKLEEKVYECAGEEFNIGSPPQMQHILYKKMGFEPFKRTKTGHSADVESLEYISTQPHSEIANYLLDRSYLNTMLNTHIGQALAFRWDEDNRVHTNYNITGAVTGRASCSQPSLQNVPQDALVRSLYTASPGCLLVEADLKSAEIATIAAMSKEESFIRAFQEGLDIHSETFKTMYDLPEDYVCTKLERRMAKTVNFGLIYGLTAIGLARRLGITVEEATEFMGLYFERLSNIKRWMDRQRALVKRDGYVISVFGRKRRIPYGLSDARWEVGRAERQAMNSPIQSGAADYTYIGLVRLRRAIMKAHLNGKIVHTVHDCGLADTPKVEVPVMVRLFKEAFETPVKAMPIQMQIDVEINKRWGQTNESRLQEVFDKVGLKLVA
jgi:DNA polymerase-1